MGSTSTANKVTTEHQRAAACRVAAALACTQTQVPYQHRVEMNTPYTILLYHHSDNLAQNNQVSL
jgi:hypothetical protein